MEYIEKAETQKLQFVISGYEKEMIYHSYDSNSNQLSPGKPLTVETAKSIFKFVNDIGDIQNYEFKGIIPKNILKYKTDEKYVIWQTKEGIREVLYQEGLPIKSGKYWVPKLVWKLEGNRLNAWAVKKTVTKNTDKLYNAPLFNINMMGGVCMGNAKFTDSSYDYSKIIKKVEEGFWGSIFTHSSHDRLLNFNFTEWCNNPILHLEDCSHLLTDTKETIKDIL